MFGWDINKVFQSHVVERMLMTALSGLSSSKFELWENDSQSAFDRRKAAFATLLMRLNAVTQNTVFQSFLSGSLGSMDSPQWHPLQAFHSCGSGLAKMSSSDVGTVHLTPLYQIQFPLSRLVMQKSFKTIGTNLEPILAWTKFLSRYLSIFPDAYSMGYLASCPLLLPCNIILKNVAGAFDSYFIWLKFLVRILRLIFNFSFRPASRL